MSFILDGISARERLASALTERIQHIKKKSGVTPTLAIIQVGKKPESGAYIRQKKLFGEKIGVHVLHISLPETVSEHDVCEHVGACNADDSIHGIIVQLPLPDTLNKERIINTIIPRKDVDGLTKSHIHTPATARGIVSLLDAYSIPIKGMRAVVVGRSELVGKPTADALLARGATVVVCHRQTPDLAAETLRADILVVAAGSPGLITKNHVTSGQVVVDVGINTLSLEDGRKKMVGDVLFDDVAPIVSAISPVPGGVGPMTVLSLFQNLIDAIVLL